jgi:hypothetical protein
MVRHKRVSDSTNLERKHAGFELVGEAEEARLMAARNKYPNKLAWRRRRRTCVRGRPCGTEVLTPFGLVEVWDIGGFAVLRNDAPLYHSTCRTDRFGGDNARRASIFLSDAAAQAAAELHLALGWGDYTREPDCMPFDWDDDNLVCLDGPPRAVRASDVDDEQTWGWEEQRNGRALCYGSGAANLANLKVVFDDYSDAQTPALLWVFPWRVLLSSLPSCGYRLLKDDILHWSDELPAVAAA